MRDYTKNQRKIKSIKHKENETWWKSLPIISIYKKNNTNRYKLVYQQFTIFFLSKKALIRYLLSFSPLMP